MRHLRLRFKFLFTTLIALTVHAGATAWPEEPVAGLHAGAAKLSVTPPMGMPIVGGWDSPPAANVHDDLHVRCLALRQKQQLLAFVIVDNVGIPRTVFDTAREAIDRAGQIPGAHVLMAATHTHSGVSAKGQREVDGQTVLDAYPARLASRIAEVVALAIERMRPAEIAWGGIDEASEVYNRRWFVSDSSMLENPFGGRDRVRMNPPRGSRALLHPAGPVDPEISIVSVRDRRGSPIAVLANYSLHYVGGVPKGDVSADYFAAVCEKLRERIGSDESFVALMSNGTSGDINNFDFRNPKRDVQPYQRIDEVAELVVQRITEVLPSLKYRHDVELAAASETLKLKVRKPDASMKRYFGRLTQSEQKPADLHRHAMTYAGRVERLAEGPDTVDIMLQAIRIGDLAINAIPFEVFAETGLRLKAASPWKDSFTIELANGSEGYLPTPAQHELGGYETWLGTSRVERQASERITRTLLKLQRQW